MSSEAGHEQSFRIERHGEIAVITPSAKVEEMHETLINQAAYIVIQSLREDPPAGIVGCAGRRVLRCGPNSPPMDSGDNERSLPERRWAVASIGAGNSGRTECRAHPDLRRRPRFERGATRPSRGRPRLHPEVWWWSGCGSGH